MPEAGIEALGMVLMHPDRALHQHSILAVHGGAARVRQMLSAELEKNAWAVSESCEINDGGELRPLGLGLPEIPPEKFGSVWRGEALLHLHTSTDWAALCNGLTFARTVGLSVVRSTGSAPAVPGPVVITLHDLSLLTGGCPAPLGCTGVTAGCFNVCPQKYDNAPQVQTARHNALVTLGAHLVSPSAWLAKQVRKALPGLSCTIIPNGVEKNVWTSARAREALGLAGGARVVLFAAHGGALAGLKGAARWRELWGAIKGAVPETVGFMVGGASESRKLDLIEWPYVERDKLQMLMAASDLLVYPSLADNHPLVVLEAMSAGTAVCSYRTGGIPEQVRHGETGLLVPSEDEAGLIAAAVKMLKTSGLAREMGRAGLESWERHFRAEAMADAYQGLYLRLLG